MPRQHFQVGQHADTFVGEAPVGGGQPGGVVGMNADRRQDTGIPLGQGDRGGAALGIVADVEKPGHAGVLGPDEHVVDFAGELVAIQVQMGIGEH